MAKTISDEKMKLSVVIDSNQAQQELIGLEKATRSLTEENKTLLLEKKKVEKQLGKESLEYKNLSVQIKENNATITANKLKMKELQSEIGLTSLTMGQLTQRANILRLSLRNAIPGSEAYRRYQTELAAVNTRMAELQGRAVGTRASINNLADGFNRYAAIGASVIAVGTGVVISLQKMIDYNGKLSDAQANVMKTTRMSKTEVDELTKSFGMLQTRTSRIDLLKIAEEGGRIGIAKDEVSGFVEVMNKATVALGDSFTGGVSEVAEKLGKLKFLFKETKDLGVDEAYNSIGSAINELGADGVASERNIAEFATRVGSLPDALKPTIANALALGAAFEESGVEAEIAARAYNIFLKQAATETAKFGKVMNISQAEVAKLINADPMEFFLKFSEGMKGMDATSTAQTLNYLGINADGANKAIGAVGNNAERFRSQLALSNKSFVEASSLMDEYEIKNNTLGATIEKVQKKLIGAFSSEALISGLTSVVNWIGKVIGATDDIDGSGQKWRNTFMFIAKAIAVVTAALITNVAWQKLVVLWTTRGTQTNLLYTLGVKARAVAETLSIIGTQLYAAATMLLSGNIRGAAQAMRVLSATMMTTPWGLLLALVAAVGVAYIAFSDTADEATASQKMLNDINLEANKSISAQKKEMENLTKIVNDANQSQETRMLALKKLNELIPDHIGVLTLENIKLKEGKDILDAYTLSIQANARAKAVQSKYDDLAKQKLDTESKTGKDYAGFVDKTFASIYSTFGIDTEYFKDRKEIEQFVLENMGDFVNKKTNSKTGKTTVDKSKFQKIVSDLAASSGIAEKEGEISAIDAQMKLLEVDLYKATVDNLSKGGEDGKDSTFTPGGNSGAGTTKEKKYDNSYLETERKAREQAFQARQQMQANEIALMEEGYAKELALEQLNSAKKLHEIQGNNESIKALQLQLDIDLAKAIKDGDTKKITSIKNQQKLLLESTASNNQLILQEENLSANRIGTIQAKAANDEIKDFEETFERAKVLRETKHNEELAVLGNNDLARKALQRTFDANELIEEGKHFEEVKELFNKIISQGDFENFDLSLLTPQQVEEFVILAEKAGLAWAKLKGGKTDDDALSKSDELNALGLGGNADILGFTPEHWDQLFTNLESGKLGINEMAFAVQALTNMYAQYAAFLTANENAQLQRFEKSSETKKTKLKRQLDSGYLSQFQYNKQVENIDKELAKKKADLDYKQAKRQKAISIANIINATAQAIIGIWAQFPKADFGITAGIMSGVVGALGALQLATVMSTPLPAKGYEKGLYPDYVNVTREQDGKPFRPKYAGKLKSGLVSQNSIMVAEGNRPEMVIDNKAWSRINPEVQNALIREIRGVKGFENGYYKDNVINTGSAAAPSGGSEQETQMMQMMLSVIAENTAVMRELKDKTFEAVVDPDKMRNMKNLREGLKKFENIKEKAKK